jgi:hypothetical protein
MYVLGVGWYRVGVLLSVLAFRHQLRVCSRFIVTVVFQFHCFLTFCSIQRILGDSSCSLSSSKSKSCTCLQKDLEGCDCRCGCLCSLCVCVCVFGERGGAVCVLCVPVCVWVSVLSLTFVRLRICVFLFPSVLDKKSLL